MNHDYGLAMASFTLTGTIVGFLRYNINPAKIFMGDTGSLILGFMAAALSIAFVQRINNHSENSVLRYVFASDGSLAVALAAIIVPVYDTFRVFTLRILKGFSPFHPDRTHIHHVLLDCGFNPNQVSLTLSCVTLFFIAGTLSMVSLQIPNTVVILAIIACASGLILIATKVRNKKVAARKLLRKRQEEAKLLSPLYDDYLNSLLQKTSDELITNSEGTTAYLKKR